MYVNDRARAANQALGWPCAHGSRQELAVDTLGVAAAFQDVCLAVGPGTEGQVQQEAGLLSTALSLNALLMTCLKTFNIIIMLIKMENSEFFIDA